MQGAMTGGKSQQNIDTKTQYFCDNLQKCVNQFTKECSVINKTYNKWYTSELVKMKNEFDLSN